MKHLKIGHFYVESLKNQWFLIGFWQNLAKSLSTDILTYFEILSWKGLFYDVIMGGQPPQNLIFYDKFLKNPSFFIWFWQNLPKTFNTNILTYFEILSWKWPFYDVIIEGQNLKVRYFVKKSHKNQPFFVWRLKIWQKVWTHKL